MSRRLPTASVLPLPPAAGRRRMLQTLGGGVAACIGFRGAVRAEGHVLRIGATFANSGVEQSNGAGLHEGSSACFAALNKAGGINGLKVELLTADDQFTPELAKQHAQSFRNEANVLAILHPLGTRQTAAVMEAAPDLAIVGPNTGTVALRRKDAPNVFWVRANYDQEVERLVGMASTLGVTKLGLVHPKDPLGAGLLAAFEAACAKVQIKPAVIATTPGTTSLEVEPAVEAFERAGPEAIVMGLGAGSAPTFIRALRKADVTARVYGLSIAMNAQNIRDLGELAHGLGFSIVVPLPQATKYEIVRRYQADMEASGRSEFSLPSLEGYVVARVLAEGLRRAGPAPTRAAVIAALEQIDQLDLGGLRIGYGRSKREGSRFVDVAVVGSGGRFLA